MSELGNDNLGISEQLSEDKSAFENLYRNAFAVRERLGLQTGHHVFDFVDEQYFRLELNANAYDDMYVTLHNCPRQLGNSIHGNTYNLFRQQTIERRADGKLKYSGSDAMAYSPKDVEGYVYDTDLDWVNEFYDFSEPLPSEISTLLSNMNKLLPTLTVEQRNLDETEEWIDEDRYDRVKQRELNALEEALSTASGALYLLQLAFLHRRNQQTFDPDTNVSEFVIPKSPYNSYKVTAIFDPDDIDESWFPHIIEAEKCTPNGFISAGGRRLDLVTRYILSETSEGQISYETSDMHVYEGLIEAVVDDSYAFNPDELIPKKLLSLVKHILKVVSSPVEGTEIT